MNKGKNVIVVMSEKNASDMYHEIKSHINHFGRTKVICRFGNPIDLVDIKRLNINEAKSIIVLSNETEESDINQRLIMYYETGINKVEIFLEEEGDQYAVKCANSRSFINAPTEMEALMKYVEARAKTSEVNIGQKIQDNS